MKTHTLQDNPSKTDNTWKFNVPAEFLKIKSKSQKPMGKSIRFTQQAILLQINQFPSNRILQDDDPSKFIMASFSDLRFPESTLRDTADYMKRFFQAGLFLNGVQYRFYHHSNSQLRGRSCFLREAKSDAELDERIYQLGDFKKIMSAAKRAKRIGLLYSEAEVYWDLNPGVISDIPDIKVGDELFSDGCGLISRRFANLLSHKKHIIFRSSRYTPSVFQIRYLGYKGVLMLHPELDRTQKHYAQFRQSMKKFSKATNNTFTVVEYSKPYGFGRLNNDIIVLLASLGITNDNLLKKQREYHEWITEATKDVPKAVDFLSCLGQYPLAERVLLEGLDTPEVIKQVRSAQRKVISSFRKNEKQKAPIMVHQSRLLFGVCDPFQVLREGEVFVRITTGRRGETSVIHGDVLVVRNPCLHPGDCLKLRAVHNNRLSHLIDCIVFATVAKPGRHSAPSMSSGGDLDGDKFFVCWDKELVPTTVMESYDYPPNKERVSTTVTRADLANHFASYNNASLARVAALHNKWVRLKGALSPECQELNALHSQSVDGASIKIPDRLRSPPEATEPYIIDLLIQAASEFVDTFNASEAGAPLETTSDDVDATICQLLQNPQNALSEYELFDLTLRLARKHSLEYQKYLDYIDYGAISTRQKYAISIALGLNPEKEENAFLWNSLFQSDILSRAVVYQKRLDKPFNLQRLYSSRIQGLPTFFYYLQTATQEFTRKLLILKTDDRFAVGIFMRGEIPWNEDPEVAGNIVVCAFMKESSFGSSNYRPCHKGYKLHIGDNIFQLYDQQIGNTFVFITRPPAASGADVAASIALQKISQAVQRQIGRINRTPITAIELHVVSNRDRLAHRLFDLWFEHVPTEVFIKRTAREVLSYERNNVKNINWGAHSPGSEAWLRELFTAELAPETIQERLSTRTIQELDIVMDLAMEYHADDILFASFRALLGHLPLNRPLVTKWMDQEPQLVFVVFKLFPPDDACNLHEEASVFRDDIVRNIIRSANALGIATLVALEKISTSISQIPLRAYINLLMLASLSIRSQQLVQEILLVMNECRQEAIHESEASAYAHKHALAVAFDRADEAGDECPCDERGKPKKTRTAPTIVRLSLVEGKPNQVKAAVRVDLSTQVRLHSHVRLQAASKTDKEWVEAPILDGVVIVAMKGELTIELNHTAPPEMARMDWKMFNAGSIATARAMMDAIGRLYQDGDSCCAFQKFITSRAEAVGPEDEDISQGAAAPDADDHLNSSQRRAVQSCDAPLSLIWGPPGTGKTETVVHILHRILQNLKKDTKILMTASTHNAVDNVLERFLRFNEDKKLLPDEQVLRVATDHSKVNKALQAYTIDARVGGDTNENSSLAKKALKRVEAAIIVFTTCAGSGLGILRKIDFEVVLIDEASQITEPCALIPLVKGCKRAIVVGDHKQLRPTVKRMAGALEYDLSLLERLYEGVNRPGMRRIMLDTQYRFPEELAVFPSQEFYRGNLKTGVRDSKQLLSVLKESDFPWPMKNGIVVPTVFVQCSTEEDFGGRSKSNTGQVAVVKATIIKLTSPSEVPGTSKGKGKDVDRGDKREELTITVLTPYTKQVKALQSALPSSIKCSTVDSFQGRESDIIIFSTVRCNVEGDIGFVDDERRLNVMWTRAKLALIIVGDRSTMTEKAANARWKRAIDSCTEVKVDPAEL